MLTDDQRHPVDLLADEFASRLRQGELVEIDEYVRRFPEFAGLIQAVFPPIEVIERARKEHESHSRPITPSAAQKTKFATPERLGDFRIVCEIGRGGMGVVYEAEQQSLKRSVALKVMSDVAAGSEARRERFKREAEAAAGLHHTNIVAVFGTGEENGYLYYAMQLIRGVPLNDVVQSLRMSLGDPEGSKHLVSNQLPNCINQVIFSQASRTSQSSGPCVATDETSGTQSESVHNESQTDFDSPSITSAMSREQTLVVRKAASNHPSRRQRTLGVQYYRFVAEIIASAASGLDYAHHAGVLHRDIKPSNLMLDHEGTLWITDFGVAKRSSLEDLTQTGEIVGTLRYMAPEQLQGKSDGRSDIYSLGLTLYELLTLQPAISAPTGKWFEAAAKAQIPPPRSIRGDIPRDLETIVMKACAGEPARRYATAADFEIDLRRYLEDRPILARQESTLSRLRRIVRRNPTVSLLTIATMALMATVLILFAIGNHQQRLALIEIGKEYERAEKNLEEKTVALSAADRERARAENNLAMALEAFESVIANIGSRGGIEALLDDLGDDSSIVTAADTGLSDADIDLLEGLLAFFDRFAIENATDLSSETAAVQSRLGDIYLRLGRLSDADEAYRRAHEVYHNLRQSDKAETTALFNEIEVINDLMTVAARRGRAGDVVSYYLTAKELLEDAAEIATTAAGRFAMAKLCSTMAALGSQYNNGNRLLSDPLWNRRGSGPGIIAKAKLVREQEANSIALRLLQDLRSEDPNNIAYRLTLARAQREEIRLALSTGDRPRSIAALEESARLFEDLSTEHPDSLAFRFELAQTLQVGLQVVAPDNKQSQRLIRLCDELVRSAPDAVEYRALRGSSYERIARQMNSASRRDDAIAMMERAVADLMYIVELQPSTPIYRVVAAQKISILSEWQEQAGKIDDAKESLDEAIALLKDRRGKNRALPMLQRLETHLRELL